MKHIKILLYRMYIIITTKFFHEERFLFHFDGHRGKAMRKFCIDLLKEVRLSLINNTQSIMGSWYTSFIYILFICPLHYSLYKTLAAPPISVSLCLISSNLNASSFSWGIKMNADYVTL